MAYRLLLTLFRFLPSFSETKTKSRCLQGAALKRPVEILLEDNPADVRLLQEALTTMRTPTQIHVVEDGTAALAFLRREAPDAEVVRPDLIRLDLNLLVVILNSSSAEPDGQQSDEQCANCSIVKPTDLESFLQGRLALETFSLTRVQGARQRGFRSIMPSSCRVFGTGAALSSSSPVTWFSR